MSPKENCTAKLRNMHNFSSGEGLMNGKLKYKEKFIQLRQYLINPQYWKVDKLDKSYSMI